MKNQMNVLQIIIELANWEILHVSPSKYIFRNEIYFGKHFIYGSFNFVYSNGINLSENKIDLDHHRAHTCYISSRMEMSNAGSPCSMITDQLTTSFLRIF